MLKDEYNSERMVSLQDEAEGQGLQCGAGSQEDSKSRSTSAQDKLRVWRQKVRLNLGIGRKTLNPPIPLAAFNVVVGVVCFCVFLAFLVEIVREYVEALADPPVVLGLSLDNPSFPTILVCNGLSSVDITAMNVCVEDYTVDQTICCNATAENGLKVDENCPVEFGVFPVSSLRPGQRNHTSTCALVSVPNFDGFAEIEELRISNALQLSIDVEKRQSFSPSDVRSLLLFTLDSSTSLDLLELAEPPVLELLFLGATGFTFLEPFRLSILGLQLEISKTLDGLTLETHNIQQASAMFERRPANHTEFEVTIGYASDRIRTFTETRPSFATAFGSAAGWLGALSDGWGCLSIIFIMEKVWLLCLGRRPAWEE